MLDHDVILKFEIHPGMSPEVESVTDAIEAWADILRQSAGIIDPESVISVKLVGVKPGSQVFLFLLERLESAGRQISKGSERYPLVSKAAISLSALIGSTVLIAGVTNMVTPDARIPEDQMQVFREMNEHLGESAELQRRSQKFFDSLSREPAFDAIRVLRDDGSQVYMVPKSEFQARSGLWSGEMEDAKPRTEPRRDVWDVTLIKPVMVSTPRRWTFARDGLEFSAMMEDPAVLEAIKNRNLGILVAEGVRMRVVVDWNERFDGSGWVAIKSSRRIRAVLSPRPPRQSVPLFPTSDP